MRASIDDCANDIHPPAPDLDIFRHGAKRDYGQLPHQVDQNDVSFLLKYPR